VRGRGLIVLNPKNMNTVYRPKNRVLTLRVSEEDYSVLQQASVQQGARNLSDFARASLFRQCREGSAAAPDDITAKIEQVSFEIDSLNQALRHLRTRISTQSAEG
jgi:hypothetical protein